jgi:hypothetical protein
MKSSVPYQELLAVRTALHELHRLLLSALKMERERVTGRVFNPAEWFQLLISAPEYQWLKPLNSLLSDVDALSELKAVASQDLAILRHELETFFFKENEDVTSFNCHYRRLFTHNHDVMFSHGHLRQAFVKLPEQEAPINSHDIRRGWHKTGASRRKLLN